MTRLTCVLYTTLSRALAITGVTLIPRKSPFSSGTSTLANGLMGCSLFSKIQARNELTGKDSTHKRYITGISSSACSFKSQKGISSGPVAVFFRLDRVFQTSPRGIVGALTSGSM